jgi:hypothetical protein
MIIPAELLSVMGLAVIGHVGQNIIVNLGGKTFGIFFTIILDVAAAIIGLKYAWDGVGKIAHVFGVML